MPPRALPAVRRAARRPVRQPARRPRGGGEDGGEADHEVRRPRRDLRAPRRADAEAAREPRRPRGPGPQERRGDGAAARRRPRRHARRALGLARVRPRGGAQALRLPRVPHAARPPRRGVPATARTGAPAGGADVLEAEVDRGRRRRRRPRPLLEGLAAAGAAVVARRGVGGARGPQRRCDGLAVVTDADVRRGARGCPPSVLADRPCATPASPLLGPSPPTAPSRCCAASPRSTSSCPTLADRHAAGRLPARPGREPLPPRRPARPLRRPQAARGGVGGRAGQLDLDGDVVEPTLARRPPGPRRRPARRRRSPPPSTPRACATCTTRSRSRSSGCWRRWRTSASASTPTSSARSTTS